MAAIEFTLLGDAVWLDFINTARGRTAPPPELLTDFGAWQRWAQSRKLDGGSAPAEFPAIRVFRDRLTELADALDANRPPPGATIAALNEVLGHRAGTEQLTRVSGQWRLRFAAGRTATALEVIAQSAAKTITDRLTRVRRCAGESCTLFFTDSSPTGSRRWCDVSVCGRDARVERRRGILR